MRFRTLMLLTVATLACSEAPAVSPTPDGAVPADAASPDAASPDAASPDASNDASNIPREDVPAGALTYLEDIHPMFESAGCSTFACHGGAASVGGLLTYMPDPRTAWVDMVRRTSAREARVIVAPGDPDESVLVRHAEQTHVPAGVLTAEQAMRVRRWVADGAFYARDPASGGVPDAGVPSACSMEGARGFPMLPASCLPRCAGPTWDRVVACRSDRDVSACQSRAIGDDPTDPIDVGGLSEPLSMDCNGCLSWTTSSCIVQFCTAPFLVLRRCQVFRTGDPCSTEERALRACLDASPGYLPCQRERDARCAGR